MKKKKPWYLTMTAIRICYKLSKTKTPKRFLVSFAPNKNKKWFWQHKHCLINHGFLQCSRLRFRWRAQLAILLQIFVQPSLSGRFSSRSPVISIRSYRFEKLLSLKANTKLASVEADKLPPVNSDSIPVLSLEFPFVWLVRKSEGKCLESVWLVRKSEGKCLGKWDWGLGLEIWRVHCLFRFSGFI